MRIFPSSVSPGWPLLTALCLAVTLPSHAQQNVTSDSQLPLFDLDEVEVLYSPTDFSPVFETESPQLSYYVVPELPNGDLILALEFMDRYRETLVPGRVKWSGMLFIPVIDGEERPWLKWLCLYYYNDKMYGYDPSPRMTYDQRFEVPIRYEDRKNPEALYRFASNWVESAFPEREEEYYLYELDDPTDPESMGQEIVQTIYIPPGRIDSILTSHRGMEPEDLVKMVYEHSEVPNPGTGSPLEYGDPNNMGKIKWSWDMLIKGMTEYEDYISQAAALLKPRWTQRVRFHYDRQFLFWDINARSRGLLFNIGTQVFVYSPKWGVWRTDATIYDLDSLDTLHTKLQYPGVQTVARVEFVNDAAEEVTGTKE